ncbi:hypothetical protein BC940DRAFT_321424 [Gongronella butleri]|nr:hypothetical protein BC940DRAFT_321424 [Gongronella butleri]
MTTTEHIPRLWTGSDGFFEVEATFIGVFQKSKVKLRKTTGAVIAVPMTKLSQGDLDYVRQHVDGLADVSVAATAPEPKNIEAVQETRQPTLQQALPPTSPIPNRPMMHHPPRPAASPVVHQYGHQQAQWGPNSHQHPPPMYQQPYSRPPPGPPHHQRPPPPPVASPQPMNGHPNGAPHNHYAARPVYQPRPTSRPVYHSNLDTRRQSTMPLPPVHAFHDAPGHSSQSNTLPPSYDAIVDANPKRRSTIAILPNAANPPMRPHTAPYQPPHSHMSFQSPNQPVRASTIVMRAPQPSFQRKAIQSLTQLPNTIVSRIAHWLDVRSRHQLARTCRRIRALVLRRDVWFYVDFNQDDLDRIKDDQFHRLCNQLRRFQLGTSVRHIVLDGTLVTAVSIAYLFSSFPNIRSLSIRHCPLMDHTKLGKLLNDLVGGVQMRELVSFRMVNKKSNKRIHGDDVKQIHRSLEQLAAHPVEIDCHVCEQCNVNACTKTLQCMHCGPVPIKRCTACAPVCDHCHGRACGGMQCQAQPAIMLAWYECGRHCQIQPLVLCTRPSCNTIISSRAQPGQRRYVECVNHGLVHARCKIKNDKYVSNMCSGCQSVVCPLCDIQKCATCPQQWCKDCVPAANCHHCKCIVISGAGPGGAITSKTKITKRTVCGSCQVRCGHCDGDDTFCKRCLGLHQEECKPKNTRKKSKKKKDKTKNKKK